MSKFERVDEKLYSLLATVFCVLIRCYWWRKERCFGGKSLDFSRKYQ